MKRLKMLKIKPFGLWSHVTSLVDVSHGAVEYEPLGCSYKRTIFHTENRKMEAVFGGFPGCGF